MDDPMPTTPASGNTVSEESDDSTHTEEQIPRDDGVVIAQPIPDGVVALLVPFAEDLPTKDVENSSTLDAPST